MKATIRRILLPLDPSIFADAATRTACFIAKTHHSEIFAVAVLDSDEIRACLIPAIGPYYPMMIEEVQRKIQLADQILKECMERCAATCRAADVAHRQTEYEGIPARKLMDSSVFYDLIVTGLKNSFHFETRGNRTEALDELLDYTATPVLAVPADGMSKIERVLVGFGGSLGSARALRDFMFFARPYQPEITIVTAEEDKTRADFLVGNAELLLRAHGFENIRRHIGKESVADVFDDLLTPVNPRIDLIVLGIHSGNPIKDFFVGSFTKRMIKRGDIPHFLSH